MEESMTSDMAPGVGREITEPVHSSVCVMTKTEGMDAACAADEADGKAALSESSAADCQEPAGTDITQPLQLVGSVQACRQGMYDAEELARMNGLTLAYIGDAVYELMVRGYMLEHGSHQPDKLHRHTIAVVNAGAQSDIVLALMDELDEREMAVYKRARNCNTATPAKHQRMSDYRRATGLEALFGYLYLSGQQERLEYIFRRSMELAGC